MGIRVAPLRPSVVMVNGNISIQGGVTGLNAGEVKWTSSEVLATGWRTHRVRPTLRGLAVDCEALWGELMVTLALYLRGRSRLHPFEFLSRANRVSTPERCVLFRPVSICNVRRGCCCFFR